MPDGNRTIVPMRCIPERLWHLSSERGSTAHASPGLVSIFERHLPRQLHRASGVSRCHFVSRYLYSSVRGEPERRTRNRSPLSRLFPAGTSPICTRAIRLFDNPSAGARSRFPPSTGDGKSRNKPLRWDAPPPQLPEKLQRLYRAPCVLARSAAEWFNDEHHFVPGGDVACSPEYTDNPARCCSRGRPAVASNEDID